MIRIIILFLLMPFLASGQSANDYNSKGVRAMELKNYSDAIELFEKAIELEMDFAGAYFNKGIAYQKMNEHKKAFLEYNKAIELSDDNKILMSSYQNLAYIQRNVFKDLEAALKSADKALSVDSTYSGGHHMRGLILHDQHKLHEAIESFDKAIELNPFVPGPYYDRGIAKRKLNLIHEAIADHSMAIKVDPNYLKAYNNRGFNKVFLNDFEGAIEDYNKALAGDDNGDAFAFNNRGYAKYKLGDFKDAKIDCEKSLELDDTNSWAYHYLGLIEFELGNVDKACKLFKKAVELGKEEVRKDILEKCSKQ